MKYNKNATIKKVNTKIHLKKPYKGIQKDALKVETKQVKAMWKIQRSSDIQISNGVHRFHGIVWEIIFGITWPCGHKTFEQYYCNQTPPSKILDLMF